MTKGTAYFLKTVHRSTEWSFRREVETLSKVCGHPNIVNLVRLVDAGEGRVDGLVLDLISGVPLSQVTSLTMSQKEKWKRQISDTISFVHARDVAWGDAKPRNILIDAKTDEAVLIDFGGVTTKGSVDQHQEGTTEGDMQGFTGPWSILMAWM